MNIVLLMIVAALICYIGSLRNELETDELTKLKNRRALRNNRYIKSVVFVDVAKFKSINDTYGHAMGDKVLKHVADVLMKSTRSMDTVVRWGGDEFIILLKGDAEAVTRRIHAEMQAKVCGIQVALTIGVVENDGSPLEDLISMADEEMYTHK